MAEFNSYRGYQQFADSIRTCWRFARNAEQAEFLRNVLATSVSRHEVIPAGSTLWRAQLGQDWISEDDGSGVIEEFPSPLKPERMKPIINRAREGRANPKGIPYLYLATHQETAIAEIRPWIGSSVSIAVFELTRKIQVVNTVCDNEKIMFYLSEPEPEIREQEVWRDIDRAFSHPVTACDDTADYAPTQVLAEFFRENRIDGIAYGSSLGPGHNLVLFDISVATLRKCDLVQIRGVTFDYGLAANPYFKPVVSKDLVGGT